MKNLRNITKGFLPFFTLFTGTIFLILAGINWHNAIAAWLAPVCLLWYSRNVTWKNYFLFFLMLMLAGIVSQTKNNVFHLAVVHLLNGLSFATFYSFLYAFDKLLYRKNKPFYVTLLFPSSIVLLEYLMSSSVGTWGIWAHTQFSFKALIQITSLTGLFGISFLVGWFAAVVNWMMEQNRNRNQILLAGFTYMIVLLAVLIYGSVRMTVEPDQMPEIKIASVIGETDLQQIVANHQKGFEELVKNPKMEIPSEVFSDSTEIKEMVDRTIEAINEGAQIIVWNEDALILSPQAKTELVEATKSIAENNNVYVLLAFMEKDNQGGEKPFNNKCVLVSADGTVAFEYKKTFLHPMAEAPIINAGDEKLPVVMTPLGKVGAMICYDIDFPRYMAQVGKQQVDILLLPSYDWPGITPLHSQMAELQVLSYGCALVRANGKGLSVINDALGNRRAVLNNLEIKKHILIGDLPLKRRATLYSKVGNVLIAFSTGFLIFTVIIRLRKKKYHKKVDATKN